MNTDFQAVPEFSTGQAISAADLNALLYNNALIERLGNTNQPLFMMSHAYSPTFIPGVWEDREYLMWEGSFLYREGMRYAYLGFWYKLENVSDITSEFALGNLRGSPTSNLGLFLCASLDSDEYPIDYTNSGQQYFAFADASRAQTTNQSGTTAQGKAYQHTIVVREGSGAGSPSTQVHVGQTYITPNSRLTTIQLDIGNMGFSDGQIVPVRLWMNTYSPAQPSALVNPLTKIKDVLAANPTNGTPINTHFINYGMLYAKTDGDLSYSANWPTTPYDNTINESSLQIISQKQRYIKERLQQRPRPLTGSLVYVGTMGGTASLFYPKGDHHLADPEYTKENYWLPLSRSTYEPLYFNTIPLIAAYNINSCLASYAWNPYLSKYDSVYLDIRYFGKENTRQVFLVDLAEQPAGMSSFRRVNREDSPTTAFVNVYGDVYADDFSAATFGAYNSTTALASAVKNPYNTAQLKTYLNKAFNVRIPSLYTPVYSPQFQKYSTDYSVRTRYYLTNGLWEDSIPIRFIEDVTAGEYTSWGLFKADNQTVQFGFRSDVTPSTITSTFPNETSIINGDAFYAYSYEAGYNGAAWKWVTYSGVRGYAPIFVNLYDHTNTNNADKRNYTSFVHVFGMSTGSPEYRDYVVPTYFNPEVSLTYTQLISTISGINADLNTYYNELFTLNPHFNLYDMFWTAPKSPTDYMKLLNEYKSKLFYFTGQRQGNFLLVRGRDISLYTGEVREVRLTDELKGSLYPNNTITFTYSNSTSLISGDTEQTVIVNLDALDIPLGSRYHLQGGVIYAAEFFEEPL